MNEAELVEALDEKTVPNLKHVQPDLRMPGFVPHIYSAQVMVYNPDKVKEPPQSMSDLLDPKWKGKVGVVCDCRHRGCCRRQACSKAAPRPISTRPRRSWRS